MNLPLAKKKLVYVKGESGLKRSLKHPSGNSYPSPASTASFFQSITQQNNEIKARGHDKAYGSGKQGRGREGEAGQPAYSRSLQPEPHVPPRIPSLRQGETKRFSPDCFPRKKKKSHPARLNSAVCRPTRASLRWVRWPEGVFRS